MELLFSSNLYVGSRERNQVARLARQVPFHAEPSHQPRKFFLVPKWKEVSVGWRLTWEEITAVIC